MTLLTAAELDELRRWCRDYTALPFWELMEIMKKWRKLCMHT